MTKYFRKDEFECKCGCGSNFMNNDTIQKLDTARELAGIPFKLTSACRCDAHNKDVGGKTDSSHLVGYAVDIEATGSRERFIIIESLLKAGFTRIGIAHNFIHTDDDPAKDKKVSWVY